MKADYSVLGKKYGKLTVIEFRPSIRKVSATGRPRSTRVVYCVCDCGNKTEALINHLKSGNTRSCGCLLNGHDVVYIKHGLTKSSEYKIWSIMKQRCHNPKFTEYKRYGSKGIIVCKEWRNSFKTFYQDMGPRPSDDHSIERRDNSKGYNKSNCYWATRKQQVRNRGVTYKVEYEGELTPLASLAERLNLKYKFLYDRLRNGWTIEEAIKHPKNTKINAARKHGTNN